MFFQYNYRVIDSSNFALRDLRFSGAATQRISNQEVKIGSR